MMIEINSITKKTRRLIHYKQEISLEKEKDLSKYIQQELKGYTAIDNLKED